VRTFPPTSEISRAKVFTNDSKPTSDLGHYEHLRQLMGEDSPQHWSSEIEINDSWDTAQAFDRIVKYG